MRVFPISNWTEVDIWRYIEREDIPLPSLYYAHEREVFERDGMWLAVGPVGRPARPTSPSRPGSCATAPSATCRAPAPSSRRPHERRRSSSRWPPRTLTERGATRADDRISEAAMEDRKKEGYF